MLNQLKALCALNGASGDERAVRTFILSQLDPKNTTTIDALGNLIVTHPGIAPKQSLALFAHMDEVGVMVTRITSEGLLRISPIGIDPRVLYGRRLLVGANAIPAVVGGKAWHHLSTAERDAQLKSDELFADIGAQTKAEAEAVVSLGDCGVFDEPFAFLGDGFIASKALDNRIGCALLLALLNGDTPYSFTGIFTVCEESGCQGAQAAANNVQPDTAIVLETTTAGDADGAPADKVVCSLGLGGVVSFADRGTLYDRALFSRAFALAKEQQLPLQTKEGVFGSNESHVVTTAGKGICTIALSVPCRYLHSASNVAKISDIECTYKMAQLLLQALCHD